MSSIGPVIKTITIPLPQQAPAIPAPKPEPAAPSKPTEAPIAAPGWPTKVTRPVVVPAPSEDA